MLISLGGFKSEEVKIIAGTGLFIDIHGDGPEDRAPISLALRADIDGLEMPENNPDLSYRS